MRVAGVLHIFQFETKQGEDICMALQTHINDIMMKRYSRAKAASGEDASAAGPDFGPKYQAHVAELQRQLDEARAALEEATSRLDALESERAHMSDELGVLRGAGAGAAAAAVAVDLAALNLSGDDEEKYKQLLAAISAAEAEKAVLAQRLARMEEQHAAEVEKLNRELDAARGPVKEQMRKKDEQINELTEVHTVGCTGLRLCGRKQ